MVVRFVAYAGCATAGRHVSNGTEPGRFFATAWMKEPLGFGDPGAVVDSDLDGVKSRREGPRTFGSGPNFLIAQFVTMACALVVLPRFPLEQAELYRLVTLSGRVEVLS